MAKSEFQLIYNVAQGEDGYLEKRYNSQRNRRKAKQT